MRVANAQKLLPFSVVSLTKTAAPQLKDLLMYLLARVCKSGNIQQNKDFSCITSKSFGIFVRIGSQTNFDLVFIDSDQPRQGVMRDFELIKDKVDIIAFHDIVNFKTFGAIKAWVDIKNNYGNVYDFFELTDQYSEILNKQPGNQLFGIGVAVKKALCAKTFSEVSKVGSKAESNDPRSDRW
jgi:hypothetical protein